MSPDNEIGDGCMCSLMHSWVEVLDLVLWVSTIAGVGISNYHLV
jgi:hypothetical protein